jgi:hypothetical protein
MANATNTQAPAKKPAIEAIITMPEGWDSDDQAAKDHAQTQTHLAFGKITLNFEHGKTVEVDTIRLSEDVLAQALMHGLKQKLVDAAAMSRNPETGRSATIEDKYTAVAEVAQRLLEGEWNKRREGGATGGLLLRALIQMYAGRKTADQLKEYLAAKSDKEKAALRKNPRVAEIIEHLRVEDAKARGEDTAGMDLLAELDEMGDAPDAEGDADANQE